MFQDIADRLTAGALSTEKAEQFMGKTCELLIEAGLPLWRVGVFVRTLHPNMFGRSFVWRHGAGVHTYAAPYGIDESDDFLSSPLSILYSTREEVRRRLSDTETATNSPFLAEMRDEDVTDYLAIPLRFTDGEIHASSWTTRQPGGFTDAQVEGLRAFIPALARMIEIVRLRRTAAGLLSVYVGPRAGERILAGQIRRGHTETMNAAIWLSDLRGFTPLSDRLPPEAVVDILNQYFDCQVPAILDHGGEVLKFMGDGLLAVFPIAADNSDAQAVCVRALEAARQSRDAVAAMTYPNGAETLGAFRFGLALHVGKVLYGNIGGGNRLDFTCIGPAVNLAARIEKIAARLNRTVVASAEFIRHVDAPWSDLGPFSVAGFAAPERVYGLPEEDAANGPLVDEEARR
jgi:adenylate cyclase